MRELRVGALLLALISTSACVGPSHLRRGVDEYYNRSYVERPITTQIAFPLIQVVSVAAQATDMVFINPWYFWGDASRGYGTPYYFRNPVVTTDDEDDAEE